MSAFYAPDPINSTQFIPGSNTPASGALLFCYQVGSSTKQNTYTDQTASTARTNPIVLDSGGNIPGNGEVWIASTAKFVLAPSNDTDPPVSPYWSRDNLPGVNDPSQLGGEWIASGLTPTFVNGSTFIFSGDQTPVFQPLRRLKTVNTAGTFISTITSSAFAASTTIGILSDTIGLDSGLSSVSYGIIPATSNSLPQGNYTISNIQALNYMGTSTNSNASTGAIGEFISATVPSNSSVSLATGVITNVTSIPLFGGDWEVTGVVGFVGNIATAVTFVRAGSSPTSSTYITGGAIATQIYTTVGTTVYNITNPLLVVPPFRYQVPSGATTTIFLPVDSTFSVNTSGAFGMIRARRVR